MHARFAFLSLLLSACGLKRLMPEGPVLRESQRAEQFRPESSSGVVYSGERQTAFPIVPFMAWGVAYDLDLVIVTEHPEWDMTEIARINTPDGPLWMAKDARRSDLEQMLLVDLEDPYSWMPEIPVTRLQRDIRIEERSTETHVDMDVFYTNADDESVHISYQGSQPVSQRGKRNGSTMGHSKASIIAVLDLPAMNLTRHVTARYDGEVQPLKKILGLVPFAMSLTQTQAGIASADIVFTPAPPPFNDAPIVDLISTHRFADGHSADQTWQVARHEDGIELIQRSPLRTIRHRFVGTEHPEWAGATVEQWGTYEPVLVITAFPPVPDLSARFEGQHQSTFLMDVAGQPSHAIGTLLTEWNEDEVLVQIRPTAPWWVAERPMDSDDIF